MVSSHKARQQRRAENLNPENVSVIVDGITKVISWEEYTTKFLSPEQAAFLVKEEPPIEPPVEPSP